MTPIFTAFGAAAMACAINLPAWADSATGGGALTIPGGETPIINSTSSKWTIAYQISSSGNPVASTGTLSASSTWNAATAALTP